jgi:single-strand DNA-binding protein
MADLNKVMLIGRLGKDPEVRSMQSGAKVCSFSVATSNRWKDKNTGEAKSETEWHKVVIFNESLVTVAEKYLKKGSQVYIEGALKTRKWEKDGVDHYSTEVVLQKFNGQLSMLGKADGQENAARAADDSHSSGGSTIDDMEDDIPF